MPQEPPGLQTTRVADHPTPSRLLAFSLLSNSIYIYIHMLIEERGAVEALAHISGATSVDQHLMINSEAGFVTTILWCSTEMSNTNYSWKKLKEQLGEDIDSKVKGMVFLKGKQDVCFDIPTASVTEVQKKWHDSRRGPPSVVTQQPDPEGPQEGCRNFGGRWEGG